MELTTLRVTQRTPHRSRLPRRRAEAGFTLTEVLVSLVVLTLVAASVAGAFAIGFRTVGTAQAQARLAGDNDLIVFEEQVGRDINRAVCLKAPGGPTSIPTGGCTASTMKAGDPYCNAGGSYFLCLAWYQAGTSHCHVIVYRQATGSSHVARTDDDLSTGTTTGEQISTGSYAMSASWAAVVTSTGASGGPAPYTWTNLVTVKFAQSAAGAARPVTTPSLTWSPLSADPLSPAVPGGSVPC